jgi:hypothetical protein
MSSTEISTVVTICRAYSGIPDCDNIGLLVNINVSDEYAFSFFRLEITSTVIIEEKCI